MFGTDGTFSGQVPYPTIRLAWGWNFSSLVQGTALGEITESASLYTYPGGKKLNYSDTHTEPANYTFHSSLGSANGVKEGAGYQLSINFAWDCEGPDGPGSCVLAVYHYFHINS